MTTLDEVVAAEKAVLGSCMISAEALAEVVEIVKPGDFYTNLGERLFAAVVGMYAESLPVDPITVWDWVQRDAPLLAYLRRIGGATTLHDLVSSVPTPTNAAYYAKIVAEEAARRRGLEALTRGTQLLQGGGNVGDTLEVIQNEVASAQRPGATVSWVGDTIDEWRAGLDGPVECIPTPWPALNAKIGGWRPGKTYVIAARPGVGKTVILVQSAIEIARRGAFALSSLEMGLDELQDRIVANLADVTLDSIQMHRLTEGEKYRVEAAAREVKGLRLAVDDRPSVSIFDVAAHARSVAKREPLVAVGLDYVQLAEGVGKENRREDVAETSRQMKLLAKSLHVPVIALSQLNRQPLSRNGRTPEAGDLKDSGALEQDADVVILLWPRRIKDPQTGEEYDSPNEVIMRVDKARSGRTGTFSLIKEGEYARLKNPALQSQTPMDF